MTDEINRVIAGVGWTPAEEAFYMLYAYAKNEQGDLTAAQARALGQLVREEFK